MLKQMNAFIAFFILLIRDIVAEPTDINVFYHIFMDKAKVNKTLSIIDEQMAVLNEFAAKNSSVNVHVRYVSIGVPVMLNSTKYKGYIHNIQRAEHLEVGNEPNTLQYLYNFCQSNTNETVTYIHAKGSYHASKSNDRSRRYLMYGLFSTNGCLSNADLPFSCNVCASRFSPFPHHHFAGNMWMAHCSYIQRLISPNKFEQAMDDKVKSVLDLQGIKYAECEYGFGRFAAEHWIASHPFLKPCDVDKGLFAWPMPKSVDRNDKIPTNLSANEFNVSDAPRSMFLDERFNRHSKKMHSAAGQLFEYNALYSTVPPKGSWFWKFYKSLKK